jgi:enoyl-CoA hydratase
VTGLAPSSKVSLRREGFVAEIMLANGPLNLVTRDLLRALNRIVASIARDAAVRCVILHGGDAHAFCAGSDMKEFAEVAADASERKILFEDMVLRNLARLPSPTIAAIDGPALGGGFELALSCDLRVMAASAVVGLPECRIGGLAGSGAVRLARLVGPGRAKEMLFLGEAIDAAQALEWGLVNRVADGSSALETARRLAAGIAANGPLSNRFAKELVDASQDGSIDAALSRATILQQAVFDSEDLHEGAEAFFEKRAAAFKGR